MWITFAASRHGWPTCSILASFRRSGSPGAIGRLSGYKDHWEAAGGRLLRSIRAAPPGIPLWSTGNGVSGGVPLPARGWLDALGSSSAPELRMIPGPPPAINGKHVTTTVASRHGEIGSETPSRPTHARGKSGAPPGDPPSRPARACFPSPTFGAVPRKRNRPAPPCRRASGARRAAPSTVPDERDE